MNKPFNWDRALKQLNIVLMLLTIGVLGITTLLFEAFEESEQFEIDEVHEFCGITLFILIAIHLILFRKGLIRLLTPKTN